MQLNLGQCILKELQIIGSSSATLADLQRVLAWVESGALRPVIDSIVALERANEAHARLQSQETVGRVVLKPSL